MCKKSRPKGETIMSGLSEYFLTHSIQVPLTLGDYEMDCICHDAYDERIIMHHHFTII